MQYLQIPTNMKLDDLRAMVGTQNLEQVLVVNSLVRTPNIGVQISQRANAAIKSNVSVPLAYKINALNRASQDSDVFEQMALLGESGWRVLQATGSLPGTLKIPETVTLPSSANVIGNGQRVRNTIFKKTMESLEQPPHFIDPRIFNSYSLQQNTKILDSTSESYDNLFQFFKIPWGNMSIYSSISKEMKDFPVYPEEMQDGVRANYTTMPEIIYQYEPWQLYTSSGPRSTSYTFTFHRDMWTGDHKDGKANELVRFCMANCYPEYNGSLVNSALTTLYMNGQILIQGVLTDVTANWDGPLGHDNFYLVCKLTLSFIEVSPYKLDYWTVKNKPLIG